MENVFTMFYFCCRQHKYYAFENVENALYYYYHDKNNKIIILSTNNCNHRFTWDVFLINNIQLLWIYWINKNKTIETVNFSTE